MPVKFLYLQLKIVSFCQTLKLSNMDINRIMSSLEAKHPGESEYLQALKEV